MEAYEENKNAIEKALLNRLTAKEEHIKYVQAKNQALIDSQCKEIEEKLQIKLNQSEEKIEASRQALKEKLQAHGQKLKVAKNIVQEKVEMHSKITEEKLQKKMNISIEKRQSHIESLKQRVREQNVTVEQKKQMTDEERALRMQLYEEQHLYKMDKYKENRSTMLKARQEQLHAHNSLVKRKCTMAKERKLFAQKGWTLICQMNICCVYQHNLNFQIFHIFKDAVNYTFL